MAMAAISSPEARRGSHFFFCSGLSLKKGLILANCEGVIDSDYVEEVFVPMVNNTDKLFHIRSGERIAQIELVKTIPTINTWIDDRPTKRGNRNGGFGSTGEE